MSNITGTRFRAASAPPPPPPSMARNKSSSGFNISESKSRWTTIGYSTRAYEYSFRYSRSPQHPDLITCSRKKSPLIADTLKGVSRICTSYPRFRNTEEHGTASGCTNAIIWDGEGEEEVGR